MVSTAYDDGTVIKNGYSSDGNLAYVEDTGNNTGYHFAYDTLGRLIHSDKTSGNTIILRTEHEYDTSDRVTAQRWQIGSDSFEESYTYSTVDGTTSTMLTGGTLNRFGYDSLKRLSTASNWLIKTQYGYRNLSDTQTTSQISEIRYQYNSSGGLIIPAIGYTYDELGNISTVTSGGTTTASYAYDNQNQLASETNSTGTAVYTYDTFGNIRKQERIDRYNNFETIEYSYPTTGWLDEVSRVSITTGARGLASVTRSGDFTYDALGNPLTYFNGTSWSFTWQHGRQLATATKTGKTITNTYDVDGIRDSKTVNGVLHTYTTLSGKVVREVIGDSTTVDYAYDNNNKPFKITVNNNGTVTYGYYLLSQQGDVIGIVDSNGMLAVSYEYNAWGNLISSSKTGTSGTTLKNANALLYRGYYYDSDLGMYYLQSRFYDPTLCRFLNADEPDYSEAAATNLNDTNLFAYCGNNPVMWIDSTGSSAILITLCIMCAGGVLSALVSAAISAGYQLSPWVK